MRTLTFDLSSTITYVSCGHFDSPSGEWIHQESLLLDYELFLVTEGTLFIEYADKEYSVPENSFLLLPPLPPPYNIRRGFRPGRPSFFWLHFRSDGPLLIGNTEILTPITISALNKITIPILGIIPFPTHLNILFMQLLYGKRSCIPIQVQSHLVVITLFELFNQLSGPVRSEIFTPNGQRQCQNIITYIRSNIRTPLRVHDLAAHFGYNKKYLSTLFHQETGSTLKQFIVAEKLIVANELLSSTSLSIKEIAEELSFSDSQSFSKQYRRNTGLTPTEFRESYRRPAADILDSPNLSS